MKKIQHRHEKYRLRMRRTQGFTHVELLVVITIIVTLASIGFLGFRSVMTNAQASSTLGKMRQLAVATISYTSDHNGFIPIGDKGANGGRGIIWINQIASDLGYPELEDQLLNQSKEGMDQWAYMLKKYKDAPFLCSALAETELEETKRTTIDAIGGIGYNASPWLPTNQGANAFWNLGAGPFKAPPQLNAITFASSRCMYASSYDWHLFDNSRAYNRFGKNKAAMVFWDGASRMVTRSEFNLAVERPDKR